MAGSGAASTLTAFMWTAICAVAVVVFFVIRNYLRGRPSAEEMERRRRAGLNREGKTGDGEIVDVEADSASIVYSYSVAGVTYTASQDMRALQPLLPPDAMMMVGPVFGKVRSAQPGELDCSV
jgi:hypothetical protein